MITADVGQLGLVRQRHHYLERGGHYPMRGGLGGPAATRLRLSATSVKPTPPEIYSMGLIVCASE